MENSEKHPSKNAINTKYYVIDDDYGEFLEKRIVFKTPHFDQAIAYMIALNKTYKYTKYHIEIVD
jgi:hypothetical protein